MKTKLTPERLKKFQRILHGLREKTVQEIESHLGAEMTSSILKQMEIARDEGDWANTETTEAMNLKILENQYRAYKETADAFRRLEAGTYGICESCNGEVPVKSLEAAPLTRYCVPCLEKKEALAFAEKGMVKTSTL